MLARKEEDKRPVDRYKFALNQWINKWLRNEDAVEIFWKWGQMFNLNQAEFSAFSAIISEISFVNPWAPVELISICSLLAELSHSQISTAYLFLRSDGQYKQWNRVFVRSFICCQRMMEECFWMRLEVNRSTFDGCFFSLHGVNDGPATFFRRVTNSQFWIVYRFRSGSNRNSCCPYKSRSSMLCHARCCFLYCKWEFYGV